jgi:hypothetical protein
VGPQLSRLHSLKTSARASLFSIGLAAVLLAQDAIACPTCGGAASPKDPNIWPLVGLFMLVPWVLAAAVTILVRRESAAFFGVKRGGRAPAAHLLAFSRTRDSRPA